MKYKVTTDDLEWVGTKRGDILTEKKGYMRNKRTGKLAISHARLRWFMKYHPDWFEEIASGGVIVGNKYRSGGAIHSGDERIIPDFNKAAERLIKLTKNLKSKTKMEKLLKTEVKAEGLKEKSRKIKKGDLVVTFTKEKTLQDYMGVYFVDSIAYSDTIADLMQRDIYGIMQTICNDLNEGSADRDCCIVKMDGKYDIDLYLYREINRKTIFGFKSEKAAQKAIKICGTEFLDKLFGA